MKKMKPNIPGDDESTAMSNHSLLLTSESIRKDVRGRFSRIRRRMFSESLTKTALLILFWFLLCQIGGEYFVPYRLRIGLLLFFLVFIPGIFYRLKNYSEARRAVAQMWAFQDLEFSDLSRMFDLRKVFQQEARDCGIYTDVLHEQIGDSLAESEREVIAAIGQMGHLIEGANREKDHIAQSVESVKSLTEATRNRVGHNKEVIAALRVQQESQLDQMRLNFERIRNLSNGVCELTPLIKVITSIAQQTGLLALNAEIEAARAGNAGRDSRL